MAIYGYDRYGAPTTYGGATFTSSGFDLSPISIQEQGYGTLTLRWTTPDATNPWSRIRIVRSQTGFPVDENDGLNVREITPAAPSALHTDSGLTQGVHYYYRFFVETDLSTYLSTITYNKGQVAKSVGGVSYVSIVDNNIGNAQTNTTYWAPINILKTWVLAGQAVALTSMRFEHTTRLYQSLSPYYRQENIDWTEPLEANKTLLALSSYPALAKFMAIFGWAFDGIQTKYANISRIQDPSYTPAWYLEALSNHLGMTLETTASSRWQRVRVKNAALLARSRGTLLGLQNTVTATIGYDAAASVGVNKMLTQDQADAEYPVWDLWDAAGSYGVGDRVTYLGFFYVAVLANRGAAQGPPNGGNNTWWNQDVAANLGSKLYCPPYGSEAGWIPTPRTLGSITEVSGYTSPADGTQGNAFRFVNTSGGAATCVVGLADNYYIRAWSGATTYVKGELVSQGGYTWQAQVGNLNVTPGTDPLTWRLFLQSVPAGVDPQAIYENAIPVTPSVSWTASAYVLSSNSTVVTGINIDWYTSAGVFISTSTGTTSALTTSFGRRTVTATSPATARFAVIKLSATTMANNGVLVWRCVQMEQAAAASTWVPPRRVEMLIKPDRVNLIVNPASRVNATGYAAIPGTSGTAAVVRQTAQSGWINGITTSSRATWSVASTAAGGGISTSTAPVAVTVGNAWAGQAQVRSNKVQRVVLMITWMTAGSAFISSTRGAEIVLAANTVTNLSVYGTAPATAALAYVSVISTTGTSYSNWAISDWIEMSAVLMEAGSLILSYFDGATTSIDTFWAGAADASKSFYYQQYAQKRYRLNDIIKRSIPHGVPFTTRYADV